MTYRNCPICNSKSTTKLHTVQFEQFSGVDLPCSYDLVSCNKCDFVYADTEAKQHQYNSYYRDNNIYEGSVSESDKLKHLMTCETISNMFRRDQSILEVGFANGELLKLLKNAGFTKLEGLDPSVECVNSLNDYGIKAQVGWAVTSTLKDKYDLIIFSHVLEHILNVRDVLQWAKDLLNPDKYVYIEVPNVAQYAGNSPAPFAYLNSEHINHFSTKSLSNLLLQNGFTLIDFGTKQWPMCNGYFYPACWVVGENIGTIRSEFDITQVTRYINGCLGAKYPAIDELYRSQEEVIVWGAGSLTQTLYHQTRLVDCNIKMFVDNNKVKWGKLLDGILVHSPDKIPPDTKILVISTYGTDAIKKQINQMGLNNPVVSI